MSGISSAPTGGSALGCRSREPLGPDRPNERGHSAASGALLTPIGYQTNLMVHGPGGYRFADFLRMGAPLQVLLALVTCGGIWLLWGV